MEIIADAMLPAGTNFCKCASCNEYFRTVSAFDRHRHGDHRLDGDRRCTPTPHLPAAGLELDSRGYWRLPKQEISVALQERNKKLARVA